MFQLANELIARELALESTRADAAEDERWKALCEELRLVRPHDIAYTDTRTPDTGRIIEINPPLPTAVGPDAIEAEWFYTYLHRGHDANRTTGWLSGRVERLISRWTATVPESAFTRLRGRFTPVTAIPGHPGTSPEHARMLQELGLGHRYTTTVEPGERRPTHISFPLHIAIRNQFAYYTPPEILDRPREAKRLLRWAKLYTGQYRRVARSGEPARRAEAANHRFATLLARAEKVAPGAFRAPAYPIILIDGRYFITGASAGSYTNAARLTNRVLRERLAERGR